MGTSSLLAVPRVPATVVVTSWKLELQQVLTLVERSRLPKRLAAAAGSLAGILDGLGIPDSWGRRGSPPDPPVEGPGTPGWTPELAHC